ISHIPFDDSPNWGGAYLWQPGQSESSAVDADYRTVTPGFFEETGVRLLEGRFFNESDDQQGAPVVIVDDLLARRSWPGQSALGQQLITDPNSSGHPKAPFTVVGVVKHLRVRSVVADLTEQVFFSQRQVLRSPVPYVVKTTGDPGALVPAIRHA